MEICEVDVVLRVTQLVKTFAIGSPSKSTGSNVGWAASLARSSRGVALRNRRNRSGAKSPRRRFGDDGQGCAARSSRWAREKPVYSLCALADLRTAGTSLLYDLPLSM
ncbi:hypothetical protein MTO96_032917 [Rhipicephalus appendiculatus]